MRELTDHRVNPANDKLVVMAVDEPGSGGAHHRYEVSGFTAANPGDANGQHVVDVILFQNGPIPEAGVNGLTQEVLLSIVADRLRGFVNGPYPSTESAAALAHVKEAMELLHSRTRERMGRGVEGKHAA